MRPSAETNDKYLPVDKGTYAPGHAISCLIFKGEEVDKLCVVVDKGANVSVAFITNRQWTWIVQ